MVSYITKTKYKKTTSRRNKRWKKPGQKCKAEIKLKQSHYRPGVAQRVPES